MVKNRRNNTRSLLDESVIRNFAKIGRFHISEQFRSDYMKEAEEKEEPEEEDFGAPAGDMPDMTPPATDDFGGGDPSMDAGSDQLPPGDDMGDMSGMDDMDAEVAPEGAAGGTTAQVDVAQLVDEIAGAIEKLTGVTVERVGGGDAEMGDEMPDLEGAEGDESADGEFPDIEMGDEEAEHEAGETEEEEESEESEEDEKKSERDKLVESVYRKVLKRLVAESKKPTAKKPAAKPAAKKPAPVAKRK